MDELTSLARQARSDLAADEGDLPAGAVVENVARVEVLEDHSLAVERVQASGDADADGQDVGQRHFAGAQQVAQGDAAGVARDQRGRRVEVEGGGVDAGALDPEGLVDALLAGERREGRRFVAVSRHAHQEGTFGAG